MGDNVRRLRVAGALTQEQLSESSGLTQQYISGLERGRRNPTVITLLQIAEALGVQPMDLIRPPEP